MYIFRLNLRVHRVHFHFWKDTTCIVEVAVLFNMLFSTTSRQGISMILKGIGQN